MLTHAVGVVPARLFDTQVAAGFTGLRHAVADVAAAGRARVRAAQGRPADRLAPPAAERGPARVRRRRRGVSLLEVHDRLVARLTELGRLSWVEEACEELRTRPTGATPPEQAWLRLKDARSLRPKARAVAQAVAGWREREAAATDTPVRQVLPDLAVLGISQRQPTTIEELLQARGVDDRHRRGRIGRELLEAVAAGKESPPPPVPDAVDELDRSKRPAITLISAWVSQVARDARIDTALLATRADLVAFLRGDADARLRNGWRGRAARRRRDPADGRPGRPHVRRPRQPPPRRPPVTARSHASRLRRAPGPGADAGWSGVGPVEWEPMSTR